MSVDLTKDLVLRWDAPDAAHVPLLQEAGISAVLPGAPNDGFAKACSAAGISVLQADALQFVKTDQLPSSKGSNVVLTEGLWPGIARPANTPGRGDEVASASREPWVDSNGYWIRYLRAMYPDRPAVLGYLPELGDRGVPFDSLELALVEAWSAGGNYILSVEPNFRTGLLQRDAKALAAWKQLGQTGRWLREHSQLFRPPVVPIITTLVEPGGETPELANLMYRLNASPALVPAAAPPAPDPAARLVLVAANLEQPVKVDRVLAHASAGTIVVAAAGEKHQWWAKAVSKPVRSEEDRDFYSIGKGQLVAYKEVIADPSEFALDVIDLATHKRRAVRMWNAPSIIATATESARRGERVVTLVNYGSPVSSDVQLRVQGRYSKATLMRPEAASLNLPAAGRGTMTEVQVPQLRRLGVVVFG